MKELFGGTPTKQYLELPWQPNRALIRTLLYAHSLFRNQPAPPFQAEQTEEIPVPIAALAVPSSKHYKPGAELWMSGFKHTHLYFKESERTQNDRIKLLTDPVTEFFGWRAKHGDQQFAPAVLYTTCFPTHYTYKELIGEFGNGTISHTFVIANHQYDPFGDRLDPEKYADARFSLPFPESKFLTLVR